MAGLYTTIIMVSSLGLKKPWPGYRHPGFLEATHGGGPDQSLAFNVRPEQLLRTPQFYYLFAAATLLATGPLRSLLTTPHIFTQTNDFFCLFLSVLRIHDISVWIRILLFSSLTFKMPTKN